MTDKELQESVISDFWDWIKKHEDYVYVQFDSEKNCYLYVGFDRETLDSFTSEWQGLCEEGGCPASVQMNGICFELQDILGGYGFTMKEAWDSRPAGIEEEIGGHIL